MISLVTMDRGVGGGGGGGRQIRGASGCLKRRYDVSDLKKVPDLFTLG